MELLKDLLFFGLGSCRWCGSLRTKTDFLCQFCWQSLLKAANDEDEFFFSSHSPRSRVGYCKINQDEEYKFDRCYLFNWRPGESDRLSSYLLQLKDQGGVFEWDHIARLALMRGLYSVIFNKLPPPSRHIYLIPCPSTKTRRHTQLFTKAILEGVKDLARAKDTSLTVELLDILRLAEPDHHQRFSAKGLRKARKVVLASDSSRVQLQMAKEGGLIILIDDVITTGATARACYEALEQPGNFLLISLAYRQLPCG